VEARFFKQMTDVVMDPLTVVHRQTDARGTARSARSDPMKPAPPYQMFNGGHSIPDPSFFSFNGIFHVAANEICI
jgi:hypothetical protein